MADVQLPDAGDERAAPPSPAKRRITIAAMTTIAVALLGLGAVAAMWDDGEPLMSARPDPGAPGAGNSATQPAPSHATQPRPRLATDGAGAGDGIAASGLIIDGAGEPLAGVDVTWQPGDASVHPFASDPLTVTTAEDGTFDLGARAAEPGTLVLGGDAVFPAEVSWTATGAATRIMATRRMAVRARVTRDGAAVAGAEVTISDGSGPALDTATAGADGTVEFTDLTPGVYELWARADNHVSPLARAVRFDGGPHETVTLALRPGAAVGGRVLAGRSGEGLVATITLVPEGIDHAVREIETDAYGGFFVSGVPRGRWRVEATAPGFIDRGNYLVDTRLGAAEITLRMRPGGVVSGRVVDAEGNPVEGAALVLFSRRGNHRPTRALRERAAERPLGHIRWVHPLAGKRQLPVFGQRFGARRPGTRPAECGHGHCGVDIGRVRGAAVHAAADGTVLVASRQLRGISGRFIVLEHAGGVETYYIHLDELRSDLEPGDTVRAGDPIGTLGRTGFAIGNAHLHFAMSQRHGGRTWFVDPEPMLRHAVVLPEPGSLEGHLDTTAEPTLIATRTSADAPVASPRQPRMVTGPDGTFTIEGVSPGRYVARAFHAELAPGKSRVFSVASGQRLEGIVVPLAPGITVRGEVVGPAGPIPGARIIAFAGEGESRRAVARAVAHRLNGRFELHPLTGEVTVSARAQGFGRGEVSLSLGSGHAGGERDIRIELALSDATLRAQVLDPVGFPVRGARVRVVEGPAAVGRRKLTDDRGFFRYERMPAGDYAVRVESAGFPPETAALTTGGLGKIHLAQGGGVAVYLRDAHTRAPLAGVHIVAEGPDDGHTAVVTGARGGVRIAPLAVGRWTLTVELDGYVTLTEAVDIDAGDGPAAATEELTLELRRGATLAGVIRDGNGVRVAGATVRVGQVTTTSDQDGNFRLEDVATGNIAVLAEDGDLKGRERLQLAPGDELVTLELTVE